MTDDVPTESAEVKARWQPINAVDRRVAGVLVEKAKTTPSAYPMTLNAICTACNQKSNRFPMMNLEPEDVEESLDRLRQLGAVGTIQGSGRVSKYRHYLYEWLGADKVELAVMAELLLRGAQTEGELRARAARMEPIADLSALRPVLNSLMAKGLVVSLTPEGRGHAMTHALYPPRELEHVRAQYAAGVIAPSGEDTSADAGDAVASGAASSASSLKGESVLPSPVSIDPSELDTLREQLASVREQLTSLRAEFDHMATILREGGIL